MLDLNRGSIAPWGSIAPPNQLVVFDRRLPDLATLVAGVAPDAAVLVLDPAQDGLTQVSQAIDQLPALTAVHLLGHGQAGAMQLGATELTADSLTAYAPQLQAWRSHLTPEADILLYGCNVAAEPQPSALLAGLADLTGADVAASDDLTGQGGDWDLEVATGPIEAHLPFDLATASAYAGTLATITVTSLADNSIVDGTVTLREAIQAANTNTSIDGSTAGSPGLDTIVFAPGLTGTLTLGGTELVVTQGLTIAGPGATNLTISGNNASRILNVTSAVPLTIDGLTLTKGQVTGSSGGGIASFGTVTLNNSTLSGHSAGQRGGAIYSTNAITLNNSTIDSNSASNRGGGIYSKNAITLTNSTVSNNYAKNSGGGIYGTSSITLTKSTISNNITALAGGGIRSLGPLTLDGSSVSGNGSGTQGGGIDSSGAVTLTNSTVTGNTATTSGGGINTNAPSLMLSNTTISNNSANGAGGGLTLLNVTAANIQNTTVSANQAKGNGGGIVLNSSTATLTNSSIAQNLSQGVKGGGGIALAFGAKLSLVDSQLTSNRSTSDGGGIYIDPTATSVTVTRSTLDQNQALTGNGGGIAGQALVELINSTVSGNQANRGAGLVSGSTVNVTNSTIAFNTATILGGGLYRSAAGTTTIRNSIVSNNIESTAPNFGGNFAGSNTFSHNLINSIAGLPITLDSTNQTGVDPLLSPLANHGGPTLTHVPGSGSLAIDTGDNSFSPGPTDQTGQTRIVNGTIDLGAVEVQAPSPPPALTPEIDLLDATGGVVPIAGTTTIDVGTTRVGTPIDYSFKIRNLGDGPLNLTGLTLPAGFAVQSPALPTTLAAGGAVGLVIRLNALSVGQFSGLLTLSNNDSNENPYFFTLTGKVSPALSALQTFAIALARPPFPGPGDRPRRLVTLEPGRLMALGSNQDDDIRADRPAVLVGLAGDDLLTGSNGDDRLYGNAGQDLAYGRGGNDWLEGGTGNDALRGNKGDDRLFGGAGDDYLVGDEGNDAIEGGPGANLLDGGAGNDQIEGGPDGDAIWGDTGNDTLGGGAGNDTILAEADDDVISGGEGNDAIAGGLGQDLIQGGLGDDTILGEAGDDTLDGGTGNDVLVGGEGADRFVLRRPIPGQTGVPFIADYEPGIDRFLLLDGLTFADLAIATNDFGQPVLTLAATGEILARLQQPVDLSAADFSIAASAD